MGIKGVGEYFGTKGKLDRDAAEVAESRRHNIESEKPSAVKMAEWIKEHPEDEALAMNAASASGGYYWRPQAGGKAVKTDVPSAPRAGGPGKGKPDDIALMGKVAAHEAWVRGGMKGPPPPEPTPDEATRAKGIKIMKKTYGAGDIVGND